MLDTQDIGYKVALWLSGDEAIRCLF